jgi:Tfp pilus assembly protein PilF
MQKKCDKCSLAELDGQQFAVEGLPFRKKKVYCPACLAKHYSRINVLFLGFPVTIGLLTLARILPAEGTVVSENWFVILILFQWLLIFPHELGHAIAGKLFGFSNIRILIGAGKTIAHFRLLGFEWLLNLIPFGGLTLSNSSFSSISRRNSLFFVAGGPLVNVVGAAWAWSKIGKGGLFDANRTLPELFFWANAIVLIYNLIPQTLPTPFGLFDNDGKLLLKLLFPKHDFDSKLPDELPRWEILMHKIFKGIVIFAMALFALLAFGFATIVLFLRAENFPLAQRLLLITLFLGLGIFLGIMAIRYARHPVAKTRRNQFVEQPNIRGLKELESNSKCLKDPKVSQKKRESEANNVLPHWSEAALQQYPQDPLALYANAENHYSQKRYAQAEQIYDQAFVNSTGLGSAVYGILLVRKLKCIVWQNDIPRANRLCSDYLETTISTSDKIAFLDEWACMALFEEPPGFLNDAQIWIAKALELAPGTLTLKGTLGGILTEQGIFAEAEPLLRDCLDGSPDLGDQGISSFYLGWIESHRGNSKTAVRLLRRAVALHPAEWLIKKSKKLFDEFAVA